jgi:1,2-diacylglycerol-3-alpha-glucose alpha-1,2-glucosyltransferase
MGLICRAMFQIQPKKRRFAVILILNQMKKLLICAGLYFMRKGIDEFVEVAEQMPDVRFIWFGETNKWVVPHKVRSIVTRKHP